MARKDAGRHRGSLNNGFEQCSPGFIRLEASHQVSVRTSPGRRATGRPYFSGVFPSGLHVTTQGMLSAGDSMRTDPKDRDMHTRFLKYSDASPCQLGNGNVSRAGAKENETILRIQNNLRPTSSAPRCTSCGRCTVLLPHFTGPEKQKRMG